MNKANDRPLWIKELIAFVLASVMIVPICVFLTSEGIEYANRREEEHLSIRTKMFEDFSSNESRILDSAQEWYDRNLSANILLMTDSLKTFVTNEGYTGPELFPDGFVLSFQGERAVFPAGMGEVDAEISRELVEQSVTSGQMRTGRLMKWHAQASITSPLAVTDGGQEADAEAYLLSFGRIADGLYYVNMTAEAEYKAYMARYERIDYDELEQADQVFNGNTLLISEQDGRMELLSTYGTIRKYQSLDEMGISEEQLRQEPEVLKINGIYYSCAYSHLDSGSAQSTHVTMVQMLPIVTLGMKSLNRALAICYVMVLLFVTVVVYVFAVRLWVRDATLTRAQARRYHPRKLRFIVICAVMSGAIAVFVVATILQGIGQIHVEANYGQDMLDTMIRQMDQSNSPVENEGTRQQEDWYVYHGQLMASLLRARDGFATRERLQRWCDILNIDFIMLFDAEGNETLCSRNYSGFTLNKGLGSDSSDYRRLLLGIPSIVHETSKDATTGLERKIIGVTLPLADDANGALIMALLPEQIHNIDGTMDINAQLAAMATEDTRCFIVDESSKEVVYSSDASLNGAKILERGLSENSLRDGYMDFGTVDDDDNFILTARNTNDIFYYTIKNKALFQSVVKFGGMAVAVYLVAVAALLLVCFRGYTQAAFDRVATVSDAIDGVPSQWDNEALTAEDEDDGAMPVRPIKIKLSKSAEQRLKERTRESKARELLQKLKTKIKWDEAGPEIKAGMVFRAGMIVLLLGWGNLILRSNLTSKGNGSMFNFLLRGDWIKGVNPFSICSVALIFGLAYLINLISELVLKLLSTFLLSKGKTFCRLIHNAVKYLSVFFSLYFALLYFGFPIGTVVGSIGIVSLALSLGARDMASDVLAGLSILFEKSFEVGDIVQISGVKGVVQEIGVRSTKLLTMDNNIMTISNHAINTIVNLTRRLSWYTLKVSIPIDSDFEAVEAVLNRELQAIGNRCDGIVGELRYCGIESFGSKEGLGNPRIRMVIAAQCNEKDLDNVNMFVNREVLLLLKREGIDAK